jgi:hypothetical protein
MRGCGCSRRIPPSIKASEAKQVTLQRISTKPHIVHKTSSFAEREWTAVDKFRLKGLAKQGLSAEKNARALRLPVGDTIAMASRLGVPLGVIGRSTPGT